MVQRMSVGSAFRFGPKHFNNVRNSINFAFNSSPMAEPASVKWLTGQQALGKLRACGKQFELLYSL